MTMNIKNINALKSDLRFFSLQYANVLLVSLQEEFPTYLTILRKILIEIFQRRPDWESLN